jgi:hypothetical protein
MRAPGRLVSNAGIGLLNQAGRRDADGGQVGIDGEASAGIRTLGAGAGGVAAKGIALASGRDERNSWCRLLIVGAAIWGIFNRGMEADWLEQREGGGEAGRITMRKRRKAAAAASGRQGSGGPVQDRGTGACPTCATMEDRRRVLAQAAEATHGDIEDDPAETGASGGTNAGRMGAVTQARPGVFEGIGQVCRRSTRRWKRSGPSSCSAISICSRTNTRRAPAEHASQRRRKSRGSRTSAAGRRFAWLGSEQPAKGH